MQLILKRDYLPYGTNGAIWLNGEQICYSIELPWRNNQHEISCIPEGNYALRRRNSEHVGWHLELVNVPGRELILILLEEEALNKTPG
jgi:hypothetical protein